jgi:predicted porin
MKKSLLALAALSTLASVAQAQSVTLYGRVGGEMKTNDGATSVTTMDGAATALGTSVVGIRGSEDLGGGLTANFNLEGALATTDGTLGSTNSSSSTAANTNQVFNRQSWVGLSSKTLGAIKVGRTESATKKIEGIGDLGTNIFDLGGEVDTNTDRFGSTVSYTTPTFAGLTAEFTNTNARDVAAAYTAVETGLEINAFNIQYQAGKLLLAAGQATSKKADGYKTKNTLLGATYDAGFAKFEAAYQDEEKSATQKDKLTQFGAIVPVNAKFDLRVNYSKLDSGTTDLTKDITYTGVLAVYHLSKRTQAFAGYRNDDLGGTGQTNKFTSVGLNHAF